MHFFNIVCQISNDYSQLERLRTDNAYFKMIFCSGFPLYDVKQRRCFPSTHHVIFMDRSGLTRLEATGRPIYGWLLRSDFVYRIFDLSFSKFQDGASSHVPHNFCNAQVFVFFVYSHILLYQQKKFVIFFTKTVDFYLLK